MKFQSLNGTWNYRIGHGAFAPKDVPFSALPVGHSECERYFDAPYGNKALLKFDGITYYAKAYLNGEFIGEMLPYCEYTFDVSKLLVKKDNLLRVELEDIAPDFGPSEGWENFGGIIRDVSLLYYDEGYIDDIFFHTKLSSDFKSADFTVETRACCDGDFEYEVYLKSSSDTVAFYKQNGDDFVPHFIDGIHLWSVDDPYLYELLVILKKGGKEIDRRECAVGFREISHDGHRIMLNGKPLFLQGVCKHEMVGESRHTPTKEQIEADLLMIKKMGCNFVRLVHYPHNKVTLDIADRLGILVSEEPGLWWSDTNNENISRGSLEVLRRTIYRDRNHPSIAFWLCFNECKFTQQFLIDSARVCRECDHTRLVSGANCMNNEDTLKYYKLCNFDFYTMHPYSNTFDRARISAEILNDKPLIFTEWGGYHVYDNPHLLSDFINEMVKLKNKNLLAGAFFWCFAEVNDFNRGKPACIDGVLSEGLVHSDRTPTMIFNAYCKAWQGADKKQDDKDLYEFTAFDKLDKKALDLPSLCNLDELKNEFSIPYPKNRVAMRPRKISVGPILQKREFEGAKLIPSIIGDGDCLEVNGGRTSSITLLGMTSLPKGYPIGGDYGEEAFELEVKSKDGRVKQYTLKNGIDFTFAATTLTSSRINPIAENTVRFAKFSYEKNFEQYIINRLDVDLGESIDVSQISIKSLNKGYKLLIYSILI